MSAMPVGPDVLALWLRQSLGEVLGLYLGARRALSLLRPRVVVVGNPILPDGRIVAAIARAMGARVVSIQHGTPGQRNPLWQSVRLTRMLTWGEQGRTALLSSGVTSERITVVGAPWLGSDGSASFRKIRRAPSNRTVVLVALSGPGHQVSLPEHAENLRLIASAASRTRKWEWRIRLHPKDAPDAYETAFRGMGLRPPQFSGSRFGVPMEVDLEEATVVLTDVSTSAMDAMLQSVPVVAIARPEGEAVPEFVQFGASIRAPREEPLEDSIRKAKELDSNSALMRRATEWCTAFFGPLDGRGAQRAARVIHSLA